MYIIRYHLTKLLKIPKYVLKLCNSNFASVVLSASVLTTKTPFVPWGAFHDANAPAQPFPPESNSILMCVLTVISLYISYKFFAL